MLEINRLADVVFPCPSGLVIEDVTDEGEWIRVRARSRQVSVPCPGCAVETADVHACCERAVADVALDARPVLVNAPVRRLTCRDWRFSWS
jgi:transposase